MSIAFILKGYPRLSETFIAQEIRGLERRGIDIRIWSLRHPTDPYIHPVHNEIAAPVSYLPEYLRREPGRVATGWRTARHLPGFGAAWRCFLRDLARDRTGNRLRRFGQACVLAAELPAGIRHLHAHFLHTPSSVTRYASIMRGLRWSVSAHARDIWTIPDWEKQEKLGHAAFTVTCTADSHAHLAGFAPDGPARLHLAYHGIDPARFPPPSPSRPATGNGTAEPVVLVSVGRAVAKKGYHVLMAALARLPQGLNWRLIHIGGGPLLNGLQELAEGLGIAGRIDWRGRQPQEAVLAALRAADFFVLPSIIAPDGDRDGLPNVLMEAQSQRLACLASRVAAIPELIEDGRTGLLVAPGDAAALASALETLIRSPELRNRLGRAGERRVRTRFGMDDGLGRLARLFEFYAVSGGTERAA